MKDILLPILTPKICAKCTEHIQGYFPRAFAHKKSRITFSGNPAISFKIHGFPSLLHSRFGIFLYINVIHGSAELSRGILLRIKWVICYQFHANPFITAKPLKKIAGNIALYITMTCFFLTGYHSNKWVRLQSI